MSTSTDALSGRGRRTATAPPASRHLDGPHGAGQRRASSCTYTAPATRRRRHEQGDRHGDARRRRRLGLGTADFTFGDPTVEINKTVKAVDGKNTWNGITSTTSFTYYGAVRLLEHRPDERRDLLGDNPATPDVETDYVLDTDSATVTVHCSTTPPVTPPVDPADGRVHGRAGGEGRDAAGAARERAGQRLVHGAGQEQRPEPGAQRHGRRRGAERRHVPRRHPAARGRRLLDHRRRPAAVQPGHARPRCRACDRRLGPRHADRDVRQLRDGDRRRQGHERREQQGVRLDARHRSGDAAGRRRPSRSRPSRRRSRSPRRTSAACSR